MGLGPPVCMLCKLIMKLNDSPSYWTCIRCNKNSSEENVSHLFCLTKEELLNVENNTEKEINNANSGKRNYPINKK